MLFKDVKQNYPIYILDKQSLTYKQGKATAVGFPRYDTTNGRSGSNAMLIDITIETDGKTATYAIPENLDVTYAGNIVLSTDRDGLSREIESMKSTAEQIIASVHRQEEILEKSTALLSEINPVYKERKETEERFNKIECSVSEMKDMLSSFIKEFKG